jgi:hypothetical protein
MSEWFGKALILTGEVIPNEPLPDHQQMALEIYAKVLKELHK